MTVAGDRQSASLLSALAEAPDSAAASAFLAAQLAELSGAERVHMFRVDANQESLISVAGFDRGRPAAAAPLLLSDFGSPVVLSALALSPVVGTKPHRGFDGFDEWTSLLMTQLRNRLSPPVMSRQQAAELLAPHGLTPIQRAE